MRALAAAALLVALPAPAHAATPRVVTAVAQTYAPADQAIAAGDPLRFVNLDADRHDVTAVNTGDDGLPVFGTPVTPPGGTAVVAGVERLGPGVYQFFCSVHEYMRGTVAVA